MAYSIKGKGKFVARKRRHLRLRKKINGTPERPRLVVTRSNRHMVAQVVDDTIGHTLCAASTLEEAAKGVVTVITHAARIGMPLAELVDLEKEKARLAKSLKKNQAELDKLNAKLQNPGFLAKAPENVVKAEQERAEKLAALIAQLQEQAASL